MIDTSTIGYMIDKGSRLSIHCEQPNCLPSKTVYVDLEALARRLGREHSTLHWDLLPHFVCDRCDKAGRPKKIGFIHHVYTGPKEGMPAAVPRIMPP